MKIHIVQKGDSLWEIAQQYGVDFEELKQVNSHLSSPDMIMPGMKIKIPGSSKAVKQQQMQQKPKEHAYKDVSPKPLPVIKEDDKEKPKMMKPEMPVHQMPPMPAQPQMQMPMMEQDFHNYTTINFPQMPMPKQPEKKEMKKEEPKKEQVKPMPLPYPMPQPQPQQPMVPLCCYVMDPCYPQVPFQMMGPAPFGYGGPGHHHGHHPMPQVQGAMDAKHDCGCGGSKPSYGMYRNQDYQVPPTLQQPEGMNQQQPQQPQQQQQQQQPQQQQQQQQPEGIYQQQPSNLYPPQVRNDMYQHPHPMPPGYPPYASFGDEQQQSGNNQSE
ncbi:SafA/ExsA family spore coat assembly protein [Virgibacillus salexigens]|uniref:SafA/ExsA family spore coat assembly protein n=1 Tax=Virgibacillus salexigens TaxID=61016 RepID=UPI003081D831